MELHLTNSTIQIHDLGCGCRDPLRHMLHLLLNNKIESTIKEETKQQIKCLLEQDSGDGETTAVDTPHGGVDDLEPGDLDALFGEPFEDDSG